MAKKQAVIKQISGITLAGKADSNHWVMMDGSPTFGGADSASSPKEMLLIALGGCTSMDVIPILQKKRAPIEGYELHISATVAEEHPKVFTDIHMEYIFYGEGLNPADIERAIDLSTSKYCAASAMLRESVKITHAYRIEKPKRMAG